mgnify:FL=1
MYGKRKPTPDTDNGVQDPYPQQCHWRKNTPWTPGGDHRCQMLGTMGYGHETTTPGGETGTWFCDIHYFARQSTPPELESFEALLVWLHKTTLAYPASQWNDDPQLIWERLHGTWEKPATWQPDHPTRGDDQLPTREELTRILSRLTPGLWADVVRKKAQGRPHMPDDPQREEIVPTPEALRRAGAKRSAQLQQAQAHGLLAHEEEDDD